MTEVVRDSKAKNIKHEVLGHIVELTEANRTDKFAIAMLAATLQHKPERMLEIYEAYIEPRIVNPDDYADGVIFQLIILETNRISADMMEGAVKKPAKPK